MFVLLCRLIGPALADLKVTIVSYVINEFKFEQAIHEKEEFMHL